MSQTVVTCPHCKRQGSIGENLAGRKLACPHCKGMFVAPASSLAASEPIPEVIPDNPLGFLENAPTISKVQGSRYPQKEPRKKSAWWGGKKEIRATCTACGHVWHYLPGERMQEFSENMSASGKRIQQAGCGLTPCGCLLGPFMSAPPKRSTLTTRCPKCNSSAISRETVVH